MQDRQRLLPNTFEREKKFYDFFIVCDVSEVFVLDIAGLQIKTDDWKHRVAPFWMGKCRESSPEEVDFISSSSRRTLSNSRRLATDSEHW